MKVKILLIAIISILLSCDKDETSSNNISGEVKLQVTEYGAMHP